jgi:hypothetical protein
MKSKFSEILNCQKALEFQCPKKWDSMIKTNDNSIRNCEVCNQDVHICLTPEDFIRNGKLGRCVAVSKEILPGNPAGIGVETFAGQPSYEEVQRLDLFYSQCKKWWDDALVEGSLSFSKFTGNKFFPLACAYIAEKDFRRVVTIAKLIGDTTELVDILIKAGDSLVEQGQIDLGREFLLKAYSLTDVKIYFGTRIKLVSALVEVNQFDKAFNIARLLKSKLFLSEVAERLKEKGEPVQGQRFINLIYETT